MDKIKIDKVILSEIKCLIDDKEYSFLDKINDTISNDISEVQKREVVLKNIIDSNYTLESDTLKSIMADVTKLQNTKTSDALISKVSEITSSENYSDFITFVDDKNDYYIIGDLHDDMGSFDQILKSINFAKKFNDIKLIFLGDYVDRGKDRLTLINKIIFLKYLLPDNIHLLRGNHELYRVDENGNYLSPMMGATPGSHHFDLLSFLVNSDSEKNQEFAKKNGIDKELINLYRDVFDSMPTVALFNFKNIKVCAMHGGLPRPNLNYERLYDGAEFNSFNSLLDSNTIDAIGIPQKENMLWSDPFDGDDEAFKNNSEGRFSYSKNQFIEFCKKYDIDMILRAHERQNNGYKAYFDGRLISVFSSGGRNIENDEIVNENTYYTSISPNILRIDNPNTILSINIDFKKGISKTLEESFKIKDIQQARQNHEVEIETIELNKKFDADSIFESIETNKDIILVVDLKDPNRRKIVIPKEGKAQFTLRGVNKLEEDFFGVHKDTYFEIDQEQGKITNLAENILNIGDNGVLLYKDQSAHIHSKFILKFENGGSLGFVI